MVYGLGLGVGLGCLNNSTELLSIQIVKQLDDFQVGV